MSNLFKKLMLYLNPAIVFQQTTKVIKFRSTQGFAHSAHNFHLI
jgi:hypothetical protein